jgi:hypothetical protein
MARMQILVSTNEAMDAMHDLNSHIICRYPLLVKSDESARGKLTPNEADYSTTSDAFCMLNLPTVGDWPLGNKPAVGSRLIFETDITAWNQVILGLRTSENTIPSGLPISEFLGNPRTIIWTEMSSLAMAVVMNIHYSNLGVSTIALDNAFTNTDSVAMQNMARDFFAQITSNGGFKPSRSGKMFKNLFECVGRGYDRGHH